MSLFGCDFLLCYGIILVFEGVLAVHPCHCHLLAVCSHDFFWYSIYKQFEFIKLHLAHVLESALISENCIRNLQGDLTWTKSSVSYQTLSLSEAKHPFLCSELLLETNVHASCFVNVLFLSMFSVSWEERGGKKCASTLFSHNFPFFFSECMSTRQAKPLLFCHSALFLLTLSLCVSVMGLKMVPNV